MKIVVVGGRGLIGAKTVEILREKGHEVIAASTKSGVNSVTGEGLAEVITGADVVIDVTNSPSWEDDAVMTFFEKSTRNLLSTSSDAGVKHFIALSVVGTQRLQESGYFRAKEKQEEYIRKGNVPYTIVQATQFFEFIAGIADASFKDGELHLPTAHMQPIAAVDVSEIMAEVAVSAPLNGTLEIAGRDCVRICDIVSEYLKAKHDDRRVKASADAYYYGLRLQDKSLVPAAGARMADTRFKDWLQNN